MPINFPTYEQQQQTLTLLQEIGVDVNTLLAEQVVKSVQRGVAMFTSSSPVTINFSAVNLSKTFILLSPSANIGAVYYDTASLTNTSMRLYINGYTSTIQVNWQIIEYY